MLPAAATFETAGLVHNFPFVEIADYTKSHKGTPRTELRTVQGNVLVASDMTWFGGLATHGVSGGRAFGIAGDLTKRFDARTA